MGFIEIDDLDQYYKIIMDKENCKKLIVSFFTATWCGPCKSIYPVITNIGEHNDEIFILKVDVDKCEDISEQCGIDCMPTFVFYKNNNIEPCKKFSGADQNTLINTITELLEETENETVEIVN